MANESFLSLSASSLELKPATRSEPYCSTPQFNPFSPLHFVALLITSIKVLCLSVAANLHAAATEQKVCVCLALETLLSCYCSSAAGKLFARPGPRASVVLHGAAGTVGTAAADPSRPALGTSDKVMPSQGYHENCPAPAGQLLLMRLNNEWQREGMGHATWGRRIWCLGRAWAWIWIWALHLGLGLQSRSP